MIRVHVPAYFDHQNDPHPVTLVRLCNAKLYEKTSSALMEVSSCCLPLLSSGTFLLWQPPTYPHLAVIAELLLEWEHSRQSVLLVTPQPE